MTFKDIAIKNFKFNIKKYFAFFICNSFCVTVFFMYSTLFYNNDIVKKIKNSLIYEWILGSLIVIGIFSLFFISYAHLTFIKSRAKELGLFINLGMEKKDVNRLIKLENKIISFTSLLIGLIIGTVFSRLFFMLVIKILNATHIKYSLDYKSYIITIILFLLIHIVVEIKARLYINKLEILDLFKEKRKGENIKNSKLWVGILGLALIVVSYILLDLTIEGKIFKEANNGSIECYMYFFYVIMCIIGVYFTISEFGTLIMETARKNKNNYYNNIINISEINYKFSQYKKILFIVCILSSAAIFFIGLAYGVYITTLDNVNARNPYDIMYIESYNENKLSKNQINNILKNNDTALKNEKSLEFTQIKLMKKDNNNKYELWSDNIAVISDESLSKVLGEKIDVKPGKVISWKAIGGKNNWCEVGENLEIINNKSNKKYELKVQEEIKKSIVNVISYSKYYFYTGIVVDKQLYENIKKDYSNKEIFMVRGFNFNDWEKTGEIYKNLLKQVIPNNNLYNKDTLIQKGLEKGVISKYESYKFYLQRNELLLFVICFIGLLFFISTGVVLYFKVYNDVQDTKERYNQLYKIGITTKEVKKSFSKELIPIFFIPIILGSSMGIIYIAILTQQMAFYEKLIKNCLLVAIVYFMLQMIFYIVTKNKFYKEIIK